MQARFKTNHGDFTVTLDAKAAPLTVANFVEYVRSRFYDGLIFHRVIDELIQGGGFAPGMKQKETRDTIRNESKGSYALGLRNKPYTIAMARTSAPHPESAQFFINVKTNAFLDYPGQDGWGYCVFGTVTDGTETIDSIKAVKTQRNGMFADVPVDDVVIHSVEMLAVFSGKISETPAAQ